MGHFSVHCALSGIPIKYGEVVAFKLIQDKYREDSWVPNSFPIFGQYSTYGGIDNNDDIEWESAAFVNVNIWNNLPSFYDQCRDLYFVSKDYQTQYKDTISFFKEIKIAIESNKTFSPFHLAPEIKINPIECTPIKYVKTMFNHNKWRNSLLAGVMDKLFFAAPSSYFKDEILLEMGDFEHEVIQKIINGISDKEVDILCKIAVAYQIPMYSGKNIAPASQTYAIQDTDLKLEYKWNKLVGKELSGIIKEENARNKKDLEEEREEERKEKRLAKLKKAKKGKKNNE